jgi:hypothetical protein
MHRIVLAAVAMLTTAALGQVQADPPRKSVRISGQAIIAATQAPLPDAAVTLVNSPFSFQRPMPVIPETSK